MNRILAALSLLALMLLPACRLSDVAAVPGEAIFRDDFSSPWRGWESTPAPGSVTTYDQGVMRVAILGNATSVITVPGLDFGDVRIEADALKVGGTDFNRIGLVCRYTDLQNYYFFVVSTDGFYGLGKVTDGVASLLGMPEMQRSEVIQPQGGVNHLRADCIGEDLTLYDNGRVLAQATDPDHTSGDVGTFAGTADEPALDAVFDNFVVIQP